MSIGGLFLLFFLARWLFSLRKGGAGRGGGGPAAAFSPSGQRIIRILLHFLLLLAVPTLLLVLAAPLVTAIEARDRKLGEVVSLATALLSLPAGVWLIYIAPHWLAWRILGPAGHVRLARAVLWLGPHPPGGRRAGALALLSAAFATPPRTPDGRRANPWTALALATVAEREGERAKAEALLEALLAAEAELPRRLRLYGLEIVARQAVSRGDWRAVARRAAAGRGRGARLLRLLAQAHQGEPPQRYRLRLAWAWAAGRRASWAWVQAIEQGEEGRVPGASPVPAEGPLRSPFLTHLQLLAEAAAGRPFSAARVAALAESWESRLTPHAQEELEARGVALGVRAREEAASGLRQTLFNELEGLAAASVGDWPPVAESSLAGEILRRGRERLLAELAFWTAAFPDDGGLARPLEPALAEWQSWVRLRTAVARLAVLGGPAALHTAWYGAGLRLTACNWPVHLSEAQGAAAGWVCYAMHRWSAELAGSMADEVIALRSAENAAITRRSLVF